jgi:hypothetical protein
MLNDYTVTICSALHEEIYSDVEAYSEDEASSIAAGYFFLDHPGATGVRVASVFLQEYQEDSDYTPYSSLSNSDSSSYTPYGAPQAATTSGYSPYSSVQSDPAAVAAGFTTTLPVAPVPETSYHQTLTNGYAPYRSFRVKLPR